MMPGIASLLWSLALWCSAVGAVNSLPGTQDCEEARTKCAYRTGCARALHGYMVDCADVLAGRTNRCPWSCKRALIALTSTEAGLTLSECECGENEFCRRSKERAEICRPEVSVAIAEDTIVSCAVAEWICAADHLCSTALEYYHRLCRPLFHGRKCTFRCNNSLAILDRQPKAGKLRNCYCDGTEDFPCYTIKKNTHKLCYGRDEWVDDIHNEIPSKPDADSAGKSPSSCYLLYIFLCCLVVFRSDDLMFRLLKNLSGTKTKCLFENTNWFLLCNKWGEDVQQWIPTIPKILSMFCTFTQELTYSSDETLRTKMPSPKLTSLLRDWKNTLSKNVESSILLNFERLSLKQWPWWWTSEKTDK